VSCDSGIASDSTVGESCGSGVGTTGFFPLLVDDDEVVVLMLAQVPLFCVSNSRKGVMITCDDLCDPKLEDRVPDYG
jgi:hypothetical protein